MANGFGDGQEVPIDEALANAARIVNASDLPTTVDFEGGYASDCEGISACETASDCHRLLTF